MEGLVANQSVHLTQQQHQARIADQVSGADALSVKLLSLHLVLQ
jgi:hypothetical protein